jgi:hypothetical protein
LCILPDDRIVVCDGDVTARAASLTGAMRARAPARYFNATSVSVRGNVASHNPNTSEWTLEVDWSGAFPLYLVARDGDVIFSSHLRPLARSIGAEPDSAGWLSFLREGAIAGGRSFFRGVKRLNAGEVLEWNSITGAIHKSNQSSLWISAGHDSEGDGRRTGALSDRLTRSVQETLAGSVRPALMMSGGWDSRTLAGIISAQGKPSDVVAWCHGDLASRELRIAEEVTARCGFTFHGVALAPSIFDLGSLQSDFLRTENVVFPHWHAAGRRLKELGVDVVIAGVFGEILGGHYGSAMVLPGLKKVRAVLTSILGMGAGSKLVPELDHMSRLLAPGIVRRPWYLTEAAWEGGDRLAAVLRDDVRSDLSDLLGRGIHLTEPLIEAYLTQGRAAQYIAPQLLSCRGSTDVGIPFIDRQLLELASSTPMHLKIHNRVNRAILAMKYPSLLEVPLAATLVSAGSPILLREASRWVRRSIEQRKWRQHFQERTVHPPPRYAWANFEFVRDTRCLEPVAEDLRSPIWDRGAILARLTELHNGHWKHPAHPLVDMLMKIYTVDLMLR